MWFDRGSKITSRRLASVRRLDVHLESDGEVTRVIRRSPFRRHDSQSGFEEVGKWNFGDDGRGREPVGHREGKGCFLTGPVGGTRRCSHSRNRDLEQSPGSRLVSSTVRLTVRLGAVKAGGILVIAAAASMGCWKNIQAACKRYKHPVFRRVLRCFSTITESRRWIIHSEKNTKSSFDFAFVNGRSLYVMCG